MYFCIYKNDAIPIVVDTILLLVRLLLYFNLFVCCSNQGGVKSKLDGAMSTKVRKRIDLVCNEVSINIKKKKKSCPAVSLGSSFCPLLYLHALVI